MKNTLSQLTPLAALLMLTGCFAPVADSEALIDPTEGTTSLKVTTRAAMGEVAYPVEILAYDISGELKARQTIENANQSIKLQLNDGQYHITALSGQGSYEVPSSYNLKSSTLGIPSAGTASEPLLMGGADVSLSGASASVSLVMTYRVASLGITLAEVPAEVTSVTVGVSQQYGAIDMAGAYQGTSTARIDCHRSGALWRSDIVYLMPGMGASTTLTLTLVNPQGQVSYSYELSEPLEAAVPYRMEGTYVESSAPYISGVLTVEGWKSERTINFDFGSGSNNNGGGGGIIEVPTVQGTAIPAAGDAWDGHVVALVEPTAANEADLLLLSLHEEQDVYAPVAEGHEQEMWQLTAAYSEGALSGWSVPSKDEASALKKRYGGAFEDLNNTIELLGGEAITISDKSNNSRYLCEEGTKTFNFAESGSITTAGKKVKYRLRLVKKVHLIVK